MELNDFDKTIDQWIFSVEEYSRPQLLYKHTNDTWSIGQLFIHLIESSNYFLQNIKSCITNNENATQILSLSAKEIFEKNYLPYMEIEGPASNNITPQPENIDSIKTRLFNLKKEFSLIKDLIVLHKTSGKMKHPGLGYFNAEEWFQFTEIHLRHHFRQKDKLALIIKNAGDLG